MTSEPSRSATVHPGIKRIPELAEEIARDTLTLPNKAAYRAITDRISGLNGVRGVLRTIIRDAVWDERRRLRDRSGSDESIPSHKEF